MPNERYGISISGFGLLARLEQHPYHVLILSMHGVEAKNRKEKSEWGLLFEDEKTWTSKPIAGSELAKQLDRLPPGHRPEFLLVSACRSAKAEESAQSLASVTQILHEQGISRVLGMRLSVQDKAASAFNAELFRRIGLGYSVGRALALARETVACGAWRNPADSADQTSQAGDPFAQWTLPVLFDSTTDAPLVDGTQKPQTVSSSHSRSLPAFFIGEQVLPVLSRRFHRPPGTNSTAPQKFYRRDGTRAHVHRAGRSGKNHIGRTLCPTADRT